MYQEQTPKARMAPFQRDVERALRMDTGRPDGGMTAPPTCPAPDQKPPCSCKKHPCAHSHTCLQEEAAPPEYTVCMPTGVRTWGIPGYPLAIVYAPLQPFEAVYEPDQGLSHGTIFEALDLPFSGQKGGCQ